MKLKAHYTRQFWFLCISSLLFFASFNMILPEMNNFITLLGGADHKGLIISVFTLTALLSRPFSGKLADTIGRVPVMMFGAAVCLVCSLLYPLLTSVSAFLMLRLVHGFSTGFTPTGQSAYLSDIIPVERRGEAMGLLGTAGALGMALGLALGGHIITYFSIHVLFYCSSACALASVIILLTVRETLTKRVAFRPALLKISRRDWFEPRVITPAVVMVFSAYAYGAVFTIIPDLSQHLGILNKGLPFAYLTMATLLVRILGGKASDRWGRKPVLGVSVMLITLAMILIGMAETKAQLTIGIIIYGFGQGATSPTLLAWATDLSERHHRGKALSSVYMAMEFGIGIGALCSGYIYGNHVENFFVTFVVCSVLSSFGILFMILTNRIQRV